MFCFAVCMYALDIQSGCSYNALVLDCFITTFQWQYFYEQVEFYRSSIGYLKGYSKTSNMDKCRLTRKVKLNIGDVFKILEIFFSKVMNWNWQFSACDGGD